MSDHTWCNRIWDRLHSFTINSCKWENFSYLCCGWNVNKQSMAQNTCSLHLRRCSSVAWSLIYALALCHMLMESLVCFFKRTHVQTLVKTCRKPNPKIHWSRRWLQNVKPIGCKALQHIMAHLRYRTHTKKKNAYSSKLSTQKCTPSGHVVIKTSSSGWWCNNHLEKWWTSSMGKMTSDIWNGK